MIQMAGPKSSRLGVLFSVNPGPDSFSLLFMKVFEITASSYRFVKSLIAFIMGYMLSSCKVDFTFLFIFSVADLNEKFSS